MELLYCDSRFVRPSCLWFLLFLPQWLRQSLDTAWWAKTLSQSCRSAAICGSDIYFTVTASSTIGLAHIRFVCIYFWKAILRVAFFLIIIYHFVLCCLSAECISNHLKCSMYLYALTHFVFGKYWLKKPNMVSCFWIRRFIAVPYRSTAMWCFFDRITT